MMFTGDVYELWKLSTVDPKHLKHNPVIEHMTVLSMYCQKESRDYRLLFIYIRETNYAYIMKIIIYKRCL